jgi:hypothetical protein
MEGPLNLDAASFTSSRSGGVGTSKSRASQSRHSLPFSAPTLSVCQRCRPKEQRTALHGLRMQQMIRPLLRADKLSRSLGQNGGMGECSGVFPDAPLLLRARSARR